MKKYILLSIALLFSISGIFSQNITLRNTSTELHKSKLTSASSEIEAINLSTASTSSEGLSTSGGLSVSLSGAANYQVSFKLPPGINGTSPSIGLAYSSQSPDGIAGWGWNITGLSTITRVPSTLFHDGFIDPVDFDSSDRYALNGQRLILKSGTYGKAGSVYETENYSNVKVVAYGTSSYGSNYGPLYFIVYNPDGSRFWYGNNTSTRSKLEWAVSKQQDTQGNTINYSYIRSNGILLINNINYGAQINEVAPNVIQFFYKDKKRGELSFVGNSSFRNDNILDRVEIKSGGKLYRKYDLVYSYSSLDYERLSSISEQNGDYTALSPVKFYYNSTVDDLQKINQSFSLSPGISAKDDRMVNGDFDGDGKIDIITYKKYRHTTEDKKINLFTRIFNSSNATGKKVSIDEFNEIFTSTLQDANNKIAPKQGVVLRKGNVFKIFDIGNSASLQYTKTWSDTPRYISQSEEPENLTITRPVNGGSQSKSGIKVNAQNVISNSAAVDYSGFDYLLLKPGFHAKRGVNFKGATSYNSGRVVPMNYLSGDFNGDGITDVLAVSKPYTYSRNCSEELINDPYEQYDEYETVCDDYRYNKSDAYFINLDRSISANFSNEAGQLKVSVGRDDQLTTADFDGDGKTDIIHYQKGKMYIYKLSKNNTLELILEKSNASIDLDYPILPGDYNGDGKSDFVIPTADNSSIWKFFIATGSDYVIFDEDIQVTYSKFSGGGSYYKYKGKNYNYGPTTSPGDRSIFEYNFIPIDFNNDGKTDIIYHKTITPVDSDSHSHQAVGIVANYGMTSSNAINFRFTNYLEADNDGITKFGIPIYTDITDQIKGTEYAFICGNKIQAYDIKKDHRADVCLSGNTNNGIVTTVEYEGLESSPIFNINPGAYSRSTTEKYPYVDIANAPSFMLVKEVTQRASGLERKKRFRYHGAVSHAQGLGFLGFKRMSRTEWEGRDIGTLWTTFVNDPQKRGATIQQWTTANLDLALPISNFVNKVVTTYDTKLNNRKVFRNSPLKIVTSDGLTGVTTTQTIDYDSYFNMTSTLSSYAGGSNRISFEYANNSGVTNENYYIGRAIKKLGKATLGSDTFTTEENYEYADNLKTKIKKRGNNTSWLTESFVYDKYGNVVQKTLAGEGIVTRKETFKFDISGRFVTEYTNIEGMKTTSTYEPSTGNPISSTNEYGQKTSFTYDKWNRLLTETDYLGNVVTNSYRGNSNGGLIQTTSNSLGGGEEVYTNRWGWVTTTKVRNLNNQLVSITTEYDAIGRKKGQSDPHFGNGTSLWTRFLYDRYGRQISQKTPTGKVITSSYNNLSITVDDGIKSVTTTKDAVGNTISLRDSGGTINYTYYANGVMKTTNYGGHVISASIDGWGRKIRLHDPSSGIYRYSYNILGEPTEESSPTGITSFEYDSFGKVLKKEVKGNETDLVLNYTYDNATKLLKNINSTDRINGKVYTYTYEYDSNKRPIKTKEVNREASYQKQLGYDSKGRILFETYVSRSLLSGEESSVKIRNHYNNQSGSLYMITDFITGDLIWEAETANSRGQLTQVKLGNGLINTSQYDQYGLPVKFKDYMDQTGGVTALELEYDFDIQRGNLNSRHNKAFTGVENFEYDVLDRLTRITGAVSHTQSYDNRGRISTNSNVGDYTYSSNGYGLKGATLNNAGDNYYETHSPQQIMYNSFKKPTEIFEEGNGRVTFEYSPLMKRSVAYYGGLDEDKTMRTYTKAYSSILPVEIVYDKTNNTTKIITYIKGDAYKASVVHIKKNGTNAINEYHYLHRDHLGSILAITDSDANIVEQTHFGAWGKIEQYKSRGNIASFGYTSLLGRGYTGHEHFTSVGLIHMNGRMYDANLGRFLSPDTYIQDPYNTQSYNRYGYVWNNPLKYNDPTGEIVWVAVAIGAIIGAATAAVGYIAQAAISGNWNWGQFALSILSGALIGGISGGIAPGAVPAVLTTADFVNLAAGAIFASFLPSYTIPIGDFSISLSPAIAFGNAGGIGANLTATYTDGDFSISGGLGFTNYENAPGINKSSFEFRTSYSFTYNDGNFAASVYSTTFSNTNGLPSQKVGGLALNYKDFSARYENDGFPFHKWWAFGGILGDGKDRYRTAAVQVTYKGQGVGFNLFTGDFELDGKDKGITDDVPGHRDFKTVNGRKRRDFRGGQYSGENASAYRLGAAFLVNNGVQFGINSEGVRNAIQNEFAHVKNYQPFFKVLPIAPTTYFQYRSPNQFTLW